MANLLEKTKHYLSKKNETPSLASMSYREAREMRASLPKRSVELPLLASVENRQITMRDGATIPIRIYIPLGQGPFPIIIYYHGGGWVLNDLDTCHESCAHLANKSQHIIVSIGYRLAPEYKFPIPVNDAFDSLLWAIENANELNGNAKQISLAGDSAGGNLAIAVCQLAKKEEISIISQILLYPVTDLSYDTASYLLFEKGFGLDRDVMKWFGDYYINDEQDAFNPLVAPLKMQDFSSLPPACIFVAENDVLRDEALQYAERLKAAEVKTEVTLMEGIVHSYFTNNDIFDEEIEHTIQTIHAFLTK